MSTPPQLPRHDRTTEELLDEICASLEHYVTFPTPHELHAVTLWIAHTWAIDAADATPYLNVYSPAPRCGKTTLFEMSAALVRNPLPGSDMSPASIIRLLGDAERTLLLDEMNAVMRSGDGSKIQSYQALFNAGYRRGPNAYVRRASGANFKVEEFPVFGAKAFAGIGMSNLSDATLDRCIPILLQRQSRDSPAERFSYSRFENESAELRADLESWAEALSDELKRVDPPLPAELNERQQDIWRVLMSIAHLAGPGWVHRARAAAVALHADTAEDQAPASILLLADIRRVFDATRAESLSTRELCEALNQLDDAPWGSLRKDGFASRLQPRGLAFRLRPFGIRPRSIRVEAGRGGKTAKGYVRSAFDSAWDLYANELARNDEVDAR